MISLFKKRYTFIILLLIFLTGIFLRFYNLSNYPVGFQIDEAIIGYTGYSLIETGKDTNNHFLPLYTEVFGDNIPTGYHYLTIPSIKLFGLSEFATRLPGALFGSLTIIALFFLVQTWVKNKHISLIAALLFALSPWHIMLSRGSSEAVLSLFFIVAGFAYIFASMEDKNQKLAVLGTVFLILSFFFYHTARVFVPVMFLIIFICAFKSLLKSKGKYKYIFLFSFLIIGFISFFLVVVLSGGKDRFDQVSIFSFPETQLVLNEQQREDGVSGTPIFLTRLYHNKVINYSLTFLKHYFSHFTFDFLFLKGGFPVMFQIPNMGLLYLVELPFFLFGIVYALTTKKHLYKILFLWLLLGPVISAITTDDIPNIRRSIVMLPVLEIFTAMGVFKIIENKGFNKKVLIAAIGILFIFNISYFLHQYFIHAGVHRTWYRNNGVKSMISMVEKSYDKYDKIIVTKSQGGMYPLILFYMKMDPKIYQEADSPKDREYTGFGKFFFVPQTCPSKDKDDRFPKAKRIIYIDKGECETRTQNQKIIYREDGTRAFRIVYD